MYNKLIVSPGVDLALGAPEGGVLLDQRPGRSAGAMSLADLKNRVWHLLREDGPDTGFAAPTYGDFNATVLARDLNIAIAQFISETGLAPGVSQRLLSQAVFAGLDYPLPLDYIALARVEYKPVNGQPYVLTPLSFTEFDQYSGGRAGAQTGQPYCYREPYAGFIRLSPQPGAGNATADLITFYYTSLGMLLVNDGDTPGIPPQFQMAIVYRVLADYWLRKADPMQAKAYEGKYDVMVAKGKSFTFDSNRSTEPTIAGNEYERGWP
ncbi:MAG: hypothetical protein NVS1B2_15780 [Vulcanimicrobiaceae bacterium]